MADFMGNQGDNHGMLQLSGWETLGISILSKLPTASPEPLDSSRKIGTSTEQKHGFHHGIPIKYGAFLQSPPSMRILATITKMWR